MRKIFAVLAALICCLSVWTSVPAAQAFTLDKEDGEYSIQVELEGGSGKASVTSPTLITVKNGEVTADIQWSSSNYDYMIVDGKKYLPVNEEGTNSEFQIPVTIMDESMPVIADTTAMGTPHEINYTLTFYSDSNGSKSQMPQEAAKRVVVVALVIIVGGGTSELFRKQEKPMLNQADTCISVRLRNTKKLPYGSFLYSISLFSHLHFQHIVYRIRQYRIRTKVNKCDIRIIAVYP